VVVLNSIVTKCLVVKKKKNGTKKVKEVIIDKKEK
jgi:hypothetical protein